MGTCELPFGAAAVGETLAVEFLMMSRRPAYFNNNKKDSAQ